MKIHYIWIQGEENIPAKYKKNIRRTRKIYPEATVKIWSQEDIEILIEEKYPDLIDLIDNLKHWILLVDIGRIAILHSEGGIYVDTDVYIRKRVNFNRHNLFFVTNDYDRRSNYFGVNVRNWLIHSPKGHPFLEKYMENINLNRRIHHFWSYHVSAVTGSLYISNLLEKYKYEYDTLKETTLYDGYMDNGYDSSWHTAYLDVRDFSIISIIIIGLIIIALLLIYILTRPKKLVILDIK